MVSDGSGSWNNPPPRPFPAKVWLEARYSFRVPAWAFAQPNAHPASSGTAPRPFPAKVWLAQRHRVVS